VVVDDQPLARAGIVLLVNAEEDITVVAEAADGQAVIDGGLTTQSGQPIRVIILTTYHIDEAVYAALRAGASGFLLKDAAPAEMVNAIRAAVAGSGPGFSGLRPSAGGSSG
jgi:DNA-binding NarL/FixJ family response regulator